MGYYIKVIGKIMYLVFFFYYVIEIDNIIVFSILGFFYLLVNYLVIFCIFFG